MNDFEVNRNTIALKGDQISWVGVCPWTQEPCFGTDSGRIIIPAVGLHELNQRWTGYQGQVSEESINGIAFRDDLMCVTTRSEVALFQRRKELAPLQCVGPRFEGGAHGVLSFKDGFLAPLGPDGVLQIDVSRTDGRRQGTMNIREAAGKDWVYYQGTCLSDTPQLGLFAFAGRRTGLIALRFEAQTGQQACRRSAYPSLDIVSVASPQLVQHPRSLVALASDLTLLLTRDFLTERPRPLTLATAPKEFGRAYSVVVSKDIIFALTSNSLLILPSLLGESFAETSSPETDLFTVRTEASDVFVVGDHLVLLGAGNASFVSIEDYRNRRATNLETRSVPATLLNGPAPESDQSSWTVLPQLAGTAAFP